MADIAPWEEYALGLPPTRKPEEEADTTSAGGAFASHAAEGVAPALVGLGGWEAGAALGTAVEPGVGTVVGGIGGAIIGAYGAHKAQEAVMPTPWSEYLKQSEKEHPTASFAGELTSQVAAFRPSVSSVGKMLAGGAVGGGIEAGTEKWRGEDLDPTRIAMSIAAGSVLMKPSGLTEGFQKALSNPSPWMIRTDIAVNRLLGGENETISARVAKTQDTNPFSAAIAKTLNRIDPGHTDRALQKLDTIAKETEPSVVKQAQQMVAESMNEIRARDRQTSAIVNRVTKLVPDAERRAALTRAMEHPEEADKLLSPKEKQAYSALRESFDTIGQRAVEADVIRGMKENYITHIVDWNKSNSKMAEALDYFLNTNVKSITGRTTSRFAKTRKYETIEELNTALKDRGLSLKTEDPTEILQLYGSSMEKAIAGKNLVSSLKKMKLSDGTNLLFDSRQGGFVPKGWDMSNSHFLQGYSIHPDLKPVLEHMFYSNNPGVVMQVATATSNLSKRMNVLGSLFHSASLIQALISSGFKIAGKELVTGGAGIRSAKQAFQEQGIGGKIDKWIKTGGIVAEIPGDVDRQALSHIGAVVDNLAARSGIKLPAEKILSVAEKATMQKIDKITWDNIHVGSKFLVAEKYLEKAKLDHPEVPEEVLMKEIGEYINNSFGSLNWTQIAADSSNKFIQYLTSPNARQALNLIFFAPDWTASTLRAFTSMFGKGSGLKGLIKPRYVADFARRYQMRSALIYFTVLNGVNMAVNGKPIWENKDKTRIEFPDGTSMQMSKHALEPIHWLTDPEKTLANKLGFWPHAAITYWGEKQYPFGPDLEDKSFGGKMGRIAEQALPFQLQSAAQAPEGEKFKRFLLGTFGMPIYGMTGAQKAQARRDRQIRRNELRRKLMENK